MFLDLELPYQTPVSLQPVMQIADACRNHPWIVKVVVFGKRACPEREGSDGLVRMKSASNYAGTMGCKDRGEREKQTKLEAMRIEVTTKCQVVGLFNGRRGQSVAVERSPVRAKMNWVRRQSES